MSAKIDRLVGVDFWRKVLREVMRKHANGFRSKRATALWCCMVPRRSFNKVEKVGDCVY